MDVTKFHLSAWEIIAFPKFKGDLGLKYLRLFNLSLCVNSMWRYLFMPGLWNKIIKSKYIRQWSLVSWFREMDLKFTNSSYLWKSFIKALPVIKDHLSWKVRRGFQIFIGIDPIVEVCGSEFLSIHLIEELHRRNTMVVMQIMNALDVSEGYCHISKEVKLTGQI